MSKKCAYCGKKIGLLFGSYEFLGKEYCFKCYVLGHYNFNDNSTGDDSLAGDSLTSTGSTQSQLEAHGNFLQKQRDGTLTPEERDQYDKKWV